MLFSRKPRPAVDPPADPPAPPTEALPEAGPDPFHYGDLRREIGAALYRGVAEERGDQPTAFSATVRFDDDQRAIGLHDVVADGRPLQPEPGVLDRVNEASVEMADAPADFRLVSLEVTVDEGRLEVQPAYVVPPGVVSPGVVSQGQSVSSGSDGSADHSVSDPS